MFTFKILFCNPLSPGVLMFRSAIETGGRDEWQMFPFPTPLVKNFCSLLKEVHQIINANISNWHCNTIWSRNLCSHAQQIMRTLWVTTKSYKVPLGTHELRSQEFIYYIKSEYQIDAHINLPHESRRIFLNEECKTLCFFFKIFLTS